MKSTVIEKNYYLKDLIESSKASIKAQTIHLIFYHTESYTDPIVDRLKFIIRLMINKRMNEEHRNLSRSELRSAALILSYLI